MITKRILLQVDDNVAKKTTAFSIAKIGNKGILGPIIFLDLWQRCGYCASGLHFFFFFFFVLERDLQLQSICFLIMWNEKSSKSSPHLGIQVMLAILILTSEWAFDFVQEKTDRVACVESWPLQWIFYADQFKMGSLFAICYVKHKGEIREHFFCDVGQNFHICGLNTGLLNSYLGTEF